MQSVEKAGFTIVGVQVIAEWDQLWTAVPQAWQQFIARVDEVENRTGTTFVDVSLDKQKGVYTQVVGVEVSEATNVPAGMVAVDIPTQTYLHEHHHGGLPDIASTFERIYTWAEENGCAVDDFKLDIGYTASMQEQDHDLYVRIQPEMA